MDEDDLLTPYKEETYEQYEQRPLGSPMWISDNSVDELIAPTVVEKQPSPRPEKVVVQTETEVPDTFIAASVTPTPEPNEDINPDVKELPVVADEEVKTEVVPKRRKGRPPKRLRKPWVLGRMRKPKPDPSEIAENAEEAQAGVKTETAEAGEPAAKRRRGRPRQSEEIALLIRQLEDINAIVPEGTKRKTRPSRLLDDYDTFVPDEKRPRGRPRKIPIFPGKVARIGEKRRRGRPRVKPAKIRYLFPDGTAKQGRPPRNPSSHGLLPFIKNENGELVQVEKSENAETEETAEATVAPKTVKIKIPRVKRRPGRPRTKPPKFRLLYPDGTPLRPGRPPRNYAKLGILPFIKNDSGEYVPLARYAHGPSTSQAKIEKEDIKNEESVADDKDLSDMGIEDPTAILKVKMETDEDNDEPKVETPTPASAAIHIKRGRGRPRIHPIKLPRVPKRVARAGKKLGRPKKSDEKFRKPIPVEGEPSNPRWRIKVGGLFKFLTGNKSTGLKAADGRRSRRPKPYIKEEVEESSTTHIKEEPTLDDANPSEWSTTSNDNTPVVNDVKASPKAHKSTEQESSHALTSKQSNQLKQQSEPINRSNGAHSPPKEPPTVATIIADTKISPAPIIKSPIPKKCTSPSLLTAVNNPIIKKANMPANTETKVTPPINPNPTTIDKTNYMASILKTDIGSLKTNISSPAKKIITMPRLKVTVPGKFRANLPPSVPPKNISPASKNPLINKLNSFNTSITLHNMKQPANSMLKTPPVMVKQQAPSDDSDDDCIIVSSTLPSSSISNKSTSSPLIYKMNTTSGSPPQFLQSLTPTTARNVNALHRQSLV